MFAAWGDSLTAGAGGTPYTTTLSQTRHASVYNMGVGSETSTQIKTRMLADTEKYKYYTLIWAGRNNATAGTTVKADIAAMIAALGHSRYLVLSILNGDLTNEHSGEVTHDAIVQLNADLAALYPTHYLDIRSTLVAAYDSGDAQDVIDHAADVPPSSLRSDAIHLNTAGYTLVAQTVNNWINTH